MYIYCIGWTLQIIADIKKHTILRPWIFFPYIPFDVLKLMLTQSIPNSIRNTNLWNNPKTVKTNQACSPHCHCPRSCCHYKCALICLKYPGLLCTTKLGGALLWFPIPSHQTPLHWLRRWPFGHQVEPDDGQAWKGFESRGRRQKMLTAVCSELVSDVGSEMATHSGYKPATYLSYVNSREGLPFNPFLLWQPTESLFAAFTVEETEFVALKMVKIQCDKYATDWGIKPYACDRAGMSCRNRGGADARVAI